MRVALTLLLLLLFWLNGVPTVIAQTSNLSLGQWQMHQANYQAKAVVLAEDKIYCATEDGFFYYDKTDNQHKTLSKADGFSDVNISTLAYDSQTKTLIIAYENTNIDLLQDGEIINIDAILRKQLSQGKSIYNVAVENKIAYLSGSFGVVLLDLVKQEIKDTYSNLGPNGDNVKVFASAILNDSMYLATANGIMAARRSNNNLLDFYNWRTFTNIDGLPAANATGFKQIAAFNNKILAAVNNDAVYRYKGKSWQKTSINLQNKQVQQLAAYPNFLLLADGERLQVLDKNYQLSLLDAPALQNPWQAASKVARAKLP